MPFPLTFVLAGSALIATVSWRSLRHPGSHGFYRFFALKPFSASWS
jgi:hypothetical protein